MVSLSCYLALAYLLADTGSGFVLIDTGFTLVLGYCHCNIGLQLVLLSLRVRVYMVDPLSHH